MPSLSIPPFSCKVKRQSGLGMPPSKQKRHASSLVSRKLILEEQRRALPIASGEKKLVGEVTSNDTLVVVGETGSGKTTQLPQFLHKGGFCKGEKVIGITQPRRVAAVTVASRVAEEMGSNLGEEVGYSIRFADVTSSATRIKYMTDGMLLRESLLDPLLHRYSVIIIDEAHERTIHTDVLLGILKAVQLRRKLGSKTDSEQENSHKRSNGMKYEADREPRDSEASTNLNRSTLENVCRADSCQIAPLKLVIMSATLDYEGFCQYFNGAKAVYIQGRQHPVDILYTYTPESDYLDAVLITVFQIHLEEERGDILVFLTGQEEIESMERLLWERAAQLPEGMPKIIVSPIYAALPFEKQMRVFKPAPDGLRKVILATNIAETCVTIPGIHYVVDTGLVKARAYNPCIGVDSLVVVPISKAQALQRSGRAGREGPGKCFRLYTEDAFENLEDSTTPEIKRCNLASVILQLKALGIEDVLGFDFMDKPSKMAIVKALEHLYILGALTDEGKLSDPLGLRMASFPLEPLYAKAVLVANDFNCSEEMIAVVAMLSVESIFYTPREKLEEAKVSKLRFSSPVGDHTTLVNVLWAYTNEVEGTCTSTGSEGDQFNNTEKGARKWCRENFINGHSLRRALDIRRQIKGYVEGMGLTIMSCGDDMTLFQRCLAASFFLNAACKQLDGTYRTMSSGQTVSIHPSSVLFGKKPDCVIFDALVCTNRNYIRNVTQIDPFWLTELAPQYYSSKLNTGE